ncbi:unnamed protein product, partial [Owenia fusiformis]
VLLIRVAIATTSGCPNLESHRKALEGKLGSTVQIKIFNDFSGRKSYNVLWAKPTSVRQISKLVKQAKKLGLTVRTVGGGHSWSPLHPDPCQIGVSLSDLKGEKYSLDAENNRLTVLSSENVEQIMQWAANKNVTLGPMPLRVLDASFPGIIGTGSHSSNINASPIANDVVGLELVDGKGQVRKFSDNDEEDKEVIDACRVHLGLCGIIYKTTIKVIPDFKLKFSSGVIPVRKLLDTTNRKDLVMNNWGVVMIMPLTFAGATQAEKQVMNADPLRRIPESYDIRNENFFVRIWSEVDQNTPIQDPQPDSITLADGSSYSTTSVIKPFSSGIYNGAFSIEPIGCVRPRSAISFAQPESDDFLASSATLENGLNVLERIFKDIGFYSRLFGANIIRWMKHDDRCLLCNTNIADANKKVMFYEASTNFDGCNDYIIGSTGRTRLREFETEFGAGVMKNNSQSLPHWAKHNPYVPGMTDLFRSNLNENLASFLNVRAKYKLDKKNVFVNCHLRDIFTLV